MTRCTHIAVAVATVALLAGQATAAPGAPRRGPDPLELTRARVLTEFPTGELGAFAEALAPDGRGGLLVTVTTWGAEDDSEDGWAANTGQVWRVAPNGRMTPYGPQLDLSEYAFLTGIATDDEGGVLVGLDSFGADYGVPEEPAAGVLRVTPSRVDRVMTLPESAMPNGLAVRDRTVYVTDSTGGSIWAGPTGLATSPEQPWLTDDALAPTATFGANGVAAAGGALYVTNSDQGTVLRVGITRDGDPAALVRLAQDGALAHADGLTMDCAGRLWVAVNPGPLGTGGTALVVVARDGTVTTVTTPEDSLDYPTDVAFRNCASRPFVSNGSFAGGMPSLTAFKR